jgi:lipopolysaccharide export system protein LptA
MIGRRPAAAGARGFFALAAAARGFFAVATIGLGASAAADTIAFSADRVESVLAKGKERTMLAGRARVVTGAITITADKIELFGKDFTYIDCTGGVKVVDTERELKLEAPRLYYDREAKLTRAQGASVLTDDKNKLILKAEWIEHDGKAEVLLAQVAVRILKEKLACRAEYAVYRRNEKALELTGSPSAYKEGDEYRAAKILVNTETEEIKLEGGVSGKVAGKAKEEKPKDDKAKDPAEGTPGQPDAGGAPAAGAGAPPPPAPPPSGAAPAEPAAPSPAQPAIGGSR